MAPMPAVPQPVKPPAQPKTLPPTPPAAPAPGVPDIVPVRPRRLVNIQVELTITDQMGTGAPVTKTVSMIAADGTMGRIRASANARPSDRTGNVPTSINVDARPSTQPNDLIQLELTLFYQPLRTVQEGEPSQTAPTELNQSLTVLLQSGKPMVVSHAADPITDRRMTVQVIATIMK
jgi:hypothetical protein